MDDCKQVSWCQFSAEESKEDEEISSCSQHHHNHHHRHHLNMGNCDRVHEELECSMCGDVGLPQYLFKCLTCSHRYQHIYCSKFYPYRIEATMCNWCLPMEQLSPNTALEVDDTHKFKASNCINYSNRITKPDIDANPNRQINHRVQNLAKHTQAFEYLLQVAELHDCGHQWDHLLCPLEDADDCNIGEISEKNYVGHHLQNQICRIQEMGRIGKEICKLEPASLLMHQLIISGCSDEPDRSFYTRRGHKIDSAMRDSTISTQLQYSQAHTSHNQIGTSQDMGHSQIIKKNLNQDQTSHDQIMKKLNNHGLVHNQTNKKLNDQLDQGNVQREPAIRPVKDHGIGCSDNDDQSAKYAGASGVKRTRSHKQLQAAVGINQRNVNAGDDQKMDGGQDTAYTGCSDDSNELLEGKFGENFGAAAKRPRHRQSGPQVIAGDSCGLHSANRQRAVNSGSNDQVDIVAEDQQRALGINQISPAQQHAAAWSRAAAGKRDHLMNSPSRGISRRYKLLADVLC